MEKNLRSLGVHDGHFHADEVTACALLILFNLVDEEKIIRTRDPKSLARCEFVCDVGGIYDPGKKLFDHHQSHYVGELSSAGMVLLYLKDQKIIDQDEFDFFNNSIIHGIDDHDNGKAPLWAGITTFSHVVANFAPISYETTPEELQKAFFEALHFVFGHLQRQHQRYRYNLSCRQVIEKEMKKKKRYLFFDKAISWQESFFALGGEKHPALFVVMPAGTQWKVRGIPPDYEHRMEVRMPLPQQWAGLLEEELRKVTSISGAVFCHKGRFTSVWQTKEDARLALTKVFNFNGIKEEIDF